jgi:hypothetical protein
MPEYNYSTLIDFLSKVPTVKQGIGTGVFDDGLWWVKFAIDIEHQLAWHTVQEIGHVVNYVSLEERLATVLYPISSAPYLNGGPKKFLMWVIESKNIDFTPDDLAEWLEGRLPNPVDDLEAWNFN